MVRAAPPSCSPVADLRRSFMAIRRRVGRERLARMGPCSLAASPRCLSAAVLLRQCSGAARGRSAMSVRGSLLRNQPLELRGQIYQREDAEMTRTLLGIAVVSGCVLVLIHSNDAVGGLSRSTAESTRQCSSPNDINPHVEIVTDRDVTFDKDNPLPYPPSRIKITMDSVGGIRNPVRGAARQGLGEGLADLSAIRE